MAAIKCWLAATTLLLGACGDGSGTAADGGGGASGCNLSCLNTLVRTLEGCQPTGTCTQQLVGTTTVNACYSNGVKLRLTMDSVATNTMSMTMSVKKGGVCYSMVMNETDAGDMSVVFKNATGATLATIGTNANGEETITCPGGLPSVIDASCSGQASSAGTLSSPPSNDCTSGTCSY